MRVATVGSSFSHSMNYLVEVRRERTSPLSAQAKRWSWPVTEAEAVGLALTLCLALGSVEPTKRRSAVKRRTIVASVFSIALFSMSLVAYAGGTKIKSISSVGVLELDVSGEESPFYLQIKNKKGVVVVNEAPGGFDAAGDVLCVELLRTETDGTLVVAVSGELGENAAFGATITDDNTFDRGLDLSFNQYYGVLTLVPQSDGLYRAKRVNWPSETEACAFCDTTNSGSGDGTPNCNELPQGFPQHPGDIVACAAEDWEDHEFLDCKEIDDSSDFFGDTSGSARSQTSGKTIVDLL